MSGLAEPFVVTTLTVFSWPASPCSSYFESRQPLRCRSLPSAGGERQQSESDSVSTLRLRKIQDFELQYLVNMKSYRNASADRLRHFAGRSSTLCIFTLEGHSKFRLINARAEKHTCADAHDENE